MNASFFKCTLGVTAAAAFALLLTAAEARAQSAPATIHACAAKATGLLRLVSGPGQCIQLLETPLQWNASGAGIALTGERTPADPPSSEALLPPTPPKVVASMPLTAAGSYAITASVNIASHTGPAGCILSVEGVDLDEQFLRLVYDERDADVITLHGAHKVNAGALVQVRCAAYGASWHKVRITAVQVGEVQTVPLSGN